MTDRPENSCDIALIGGGLTTCMMAAVLRHCGYSVIWFSGTATDKPEKEDNRTTTLHHAGMKMLEALGVWPALAKDAWPLCDIFVKIERQHRENSISRGHKDTSPWPLHFSSEHPPMGYVVGNRQLKDALLPLTTDIPRYARSITRLTPANPCQLEDDKGQKWQCDLVIACDGPASEMRRQAGLYAKDQARGQTAIVTNIQTGRAINHGAWQIFCARGPLALMATSSHQASVVWTVSDRKAEELAAMDEGDFNTQLLASFGWSLGGLGVISPRLKWPLRPVYVPKRVAPGFVLAGDAAHALHPLAGMGYNLALGDAAILLDCLQQAHKRGLPAGHLSVTEAYQKRRQIEILALTGTTQLLDRALSRPNGIVTMLGATGMAAFGKTALRHHIRDIAMGGKLSPAPLFSGKLSA